VGVGREKRKGVRSWWSAFRKFGKAGTVTRLSLFSAKRKKIALGKADMHPHHRRETYRRSLRPKVDFERKKARWKSEDQRKRKQTRRTARKLHQSSDPSTRASNRTVSIESRWDKSLRTKSYYERRIELQRRATEKRERRVPKG